MPERRTLPLYTMVGASEHDCGVTNPLMRLDGELWKAVEFGANEVVVEKVDSAELPGLHNLVEIGREPFKTIQEPKQ